MSDSKVLISNIQRMCMNDGPGIRTTVFFKGCNLKCPWCANPENIAFTPQTYVAKDGHTGVYGVEYTGEDLYLELLKDRKYWRTSGGITFSGGEPLLQLKKLRGMLEQLKAQGIHMAVETALQMPLDDVLEVAEYIDLFIVDIKILQKRLAKQVLGGNVDVYLSNLGYLSQQDKNILFRVPCSKEYVATKENLDEILAVLKEYPQYDVEIFGIHSLGKAKYESLGMEFHEFAKLELGELEQIRDRLSVYGNRIGINQL